MTSITLKEAQARLAELIGALAPGEELLLTDGGQPVAHVKKAAPPSAAGGAGCYKKSEFWMSPDFDAPLDEFREYMD